MIGWSMADRTAAASMALHRQFGGNLERRQWIGYADRRRVVAKQEMPDSVGELPDVPVPGHLVVVHHEVLEAFAAQLKAECLEVGIEIGDFRRVPDEAYDADLLREEGV